MLHLDELAEAIRDRQFRYRHEAYSGRFVSHPVRRRLGTNLIHLGEAIRGQVSERLESPGINQRR